MQGGTITLNGTTGTVGHDKLVIGSANLSLYTNNYRRLHMDDSAFAIGNAGTADVSTSTTDKVVRIESTGIKLFYDDENYSHIDSAGLDVYANNRLTAIFGATTAIGAAATVATDSTDKVVRIDTNGVKLYYDSNNYAQLDSDSLDFIAGGNTVSSFGSTVTVGENANSKSRIEISSGAINFINKDGSGSDTTVISLDAAGSATFSGNITSTAGTIGGFTLGANNLESRQLSSGTNQSTASLTSDFEAGWELVSFSTATDATENNKTTLLAKCASGGKGTISSTYVPDSTQNLGNFRTKFDMGLLPKPGFQQDWIYDHPYGDHDDPGGENYEERIRIYAASASMHSKDKGVNMSFWSGSTAKASNEYLRLGKIKDPEGGLVNAVAGNNLNIGGGGGAQDTEYRTYQGISGSQFTTASFGTVETSGDIRSGGDVIAFWTSDRRLKDNIRLISDPIIKLKKIRGVEWEWNNLQSSYPSGSLDTGIIAQDVQKILPQIVKEKNNGYLGVRHDRLVGLLIEAVKAQQEQIDEMKEQIKEIKDGVSG